MTELELLPPRQAVEQLMHRKPPKEDQELSVKQSLELVKIFLNASVACVCYTRELLQWNSGCLQTRYVEQLSVDCEDGDIYQNFLNAQSRSPTSSQQVQVLVQSRNKRANCILDMLEHGVFDAIESAYLDTLQVFVAVESTKSTGDKAILETYTYHFEYEDDRVSGVLLVGVNNLHTLLGAQKSFKSAIRNLLRATQGLPSLPKRCVLGMGLAYKQNCPDIYEPPGFVSASFTHNIAPDHWNSLWETPSNPVAFFNSSHHEVNVATKGPKSFKPTTSQFHDTLMSKQLQNMQKTSSSRNHAFRSTLPTLRHQERKREPVEEAIEERESKRRREATDGAPRESREPSWSQSQGPAEDRSTAAEEDLTRQEVGALATPRRRKRSISKMFVVAGSSTPVSQVAAYETDSDDVLKGRLRSGLASSTATDD